MMRAQDHARAARLEMLLDRRRDLPRHPLLDLQTPRETVHQTRQLADADHASREISDRGRSVKRQEVVLADGVERDAAQHDHLVARLFECARQDLAGIFAVARGHLTPRANDASRRVDEAVARRVFADETKQRRDALLGRTLRRKREKLVRNTHGYILQANTFKPLVKKKKEKKKNKKGPPRGPPLLPSAFSLLLLLLLSQIDRHFDVAPDQNPAVVERFV